jgi:hypothetical protein
MRYVNTGAPWHWGILEDHDAKVGNGGVCLRDVAWCREALRHVGASEQGRVAAERYRPREEDICFSQAAFDMRAPVPPPEVAAAFCAGGPALRQRPDSSPLGFLSFFLPFGHVTHACACAAASACT